MGGPSVGDEGRLSDDVNVVRFDGDVRVNERGEIIEGDGRPLSGLGPGADPIIDVLLPGEIGWVPGSHLVFYRTIGGECGWVEPQSGRRMVFGARGGSGVTLHAGARLETMRVG